MWMRGYELVLCCAQSKFEAATEDASWGTGNALLFLSQISATEPYMGIENIE